MIGIDTNVLIRYIVRDDVRQTAIATKYLEQHISAVDPGYISQIVLCEIVWVLKRAYGFPKKIIIEVLQQILKTREFSVECPEIARRAIADYEDGNIDFSDCWIGISNRTAGCEFTVTFDRSALLHPAFRECA
ncbi:type II toxin-antitoxin system VapC family toxin [bacterium]|nr:type II toxin-antitoxin system VapC family toxin [bacterium]